LISYYKPQHKGPLPFRRPLEQAKQSPATDSQVKGSQKSQSVEDKMASLIAYRMAKELCKKCGEKCGRTHQCANLVQLHVLQEVWDLFQLEDTGTQEDSVSDQELMAISVVALTGQETAKTLRIKGSIQDIVLMLIDSGNSHSISEHVAALLQGVTNSAHVTKVRVTDGGILHSSAEFKDAKWFIQGYSFSSDLKVLPLQNLDMAVGMDWLERFSPMKVHWSQKWLTRGVGLPHD
jgi:hypothetical protein